MLIACISVVLLAAFVAVLVTRSPHRRRRRNSSEVGDGYAGGVDTANDHGYGDHHDGSGHGGFDGRTRHD
jgi:hypothetical protein